MALFFKKPKHKTFDYIPRFYDPDKEDLENRLKKYSEKEKSEAEGMKHRIRSGFKTRGRRVDATYRSKQVRKSNMILLAIIVILVFISYIFLTEYLPQMIEVFDNSEPK